MADIAPQGFINYGMSQAQQAQASAGANLENQQAQAAALQNQLMAAKMPAMLEGYRQAQSYITNFKGQNGGRDSAPADYDPASDNSGTLPASANANPGNLRVTPYDLVGRNAQQQGVVQGALQGKYNVDPSGTPQEQAAIEAAMDYKSHIDTLGDKGLSDSAQARVDQAMKVRDMNVISRRNAAQLDASKNYETLAGVATADHPFDALQAANPQAAARIKASLPAGAPQEMLDSAAEDATTKTSGFLHRFTGRETVKGEDGVIRDKDTQMPVPGVPPQGFTPEQIANIKATGLKPTTVKRNGVDTSMLEYQAAGYKNIDDYVNSMVQQARATQASQTRIESKRQGAVAIQAAAGMPPDQRIPAPNQKRAPSQVGAEAAAAQQPSPANTSFAAKQRAVGVGPMSPNANGQQGGPLNFKDAPKTPVENPGNADFNPGQRKVSEDYGTEVAQNTTVRSERLAGANAMLQGVNNAKIALDSGAATGPNQAMRTWVQGTLGNPKALQWALGNSDATAVLTKVLGNDAIKQIMGEAQGAQFRLGANTMNMAMQALAASPNMTPGAIRTMIGALAKNANYDRQKWGDDFDAYQRAAGKDTDRRASAYSAWYDNKYPNTTHIDADTLTGGRTVEDRANTAWGKYEPNKYDYRVNNGTLQRKPK